MEQINISLNKKTSTKKESQKTQKPLHAEDYCLRALQLLKKRQYSAAQKILQKGLLEVEKSAEAYHLLGLALYHQGSFQAALNQLKKACSMESKPEYLLNLSIAMNELGHYEEGKKTYDKALHLKQQSQEQNWKEEISQKHIQTAEAYLKKHQLKPALEEYIKGTKFHPNPEIQLQIARLLWRLDQKQSAEKYLNNFIRLYPKNIKARLLLAEWYFENKQIPQAVNEWESILKQEPQNQEAMNCLLKVQTLTELDQ